MLQGERRPPLPGGSNVASRPPRPGAPPGVPRGPHVAGRAAFPPRRGVVAAPGPGRGPPRPRARGAPRFQERTPEPDPQSQSFSRGYGSGLPTSLTHILPPTRGFSPRRPDAVVSTNGRESGLLPQIFKGERGRSGRLGGRGALPAFGPHLRAIRFRGPRAFRVIGAVKKKRQLSPGPPLASLGSFTSPWPRASVLVPVQGS